MSDKLPVLRWHEGMTIEMPQGYRPNYVETGVGGPIDLNRLRWILDAILTEHPDRQRLSELAVRRPGLSIDIAPDGLLVVFLAGEAVGLFDARLLDA